MTVLVSVTAEDIANGFPQDCYSCALALAIQRTIKYEHVHVWKDSFRIEFEGGTSRDPTIALPRVARDAMRQLDDGHILPPFSFKVTIRDKWKGALGV